MEGVYGDRQLEALGRRFRAAGSGGLERDLSDYLERSAGKLRPLIERSILSTLPKSGGLAARVARSRFDVRRSSSGDVGVEVTLSGTVSLASINAGRLSHPVFGESPYVTQNVPPGSLSKPIESHERELEQAIEDAVTETVSRDIL